MKDEIKEILDKLKDGNWYDELDLTGTMWIELRWEETHLLLDYITNLQEELEGYKQERERILNKLDYVKKNKKLQEENKRLTRTIIDYDELLMQRNNIIDKAIKYLPKIRRTPSYELDEKTDNLENILNGGDKDVKD